jgi:hypothetical protein
MEVSVNFEWIGNQIVEEVNKLAAVPNSRLRVDPDIWLFGLMPSHRASIRRACDRLGVTFEVVT